MGSGREGGLTSTCKDSDENRRFRLFVVAMLSMALTLVVLCNTDFASSCAHIAYGDRCRPACGHHRRCPTVWLLLILELLVLLRVFVASADACIGVWMLATSPLIAANGYVDLSCCRVGCHLPRRQSRRNLPLLRSMSYKGRRRRYHIPWLSLRASPIIAIFTSIGVSIVFVLYSCEHCALGLHAKLSQRLSIE